MIGDQRPKFVLALSGVVQTCASQARASLRIREAVKASSVGTAAFFVRVDVTEEFPFLVTKLSPYYDR